MFLKWAESERLLLEREELIQKIEEGFKILPPTTEYPPFEPFNLYALKNPEKYIEWKKSVRNRNFVRTTIYKDLNTKYRLILDFTSLSLFKTVGYRIYTTEKEEVFSSYTKLSSKYPQESTLSVELKNNLINSLRDVKLNKKKHQYDHEAIVSIIEEHLH